MLLPSLLSFSSALALLCATAQAQVVNVGGQNPPAGGGAFGFSTTWEDVSPSWLGQNSPLSVVIQPGNADRILVTTPYEGVCITSDGGQTWSNNYIDFYIDQMTPSWWVNDIVFRPTAPNEALAVTMSGTYWSADGGLSWSPTFGQRPEGSFEVVSTDDGTSAAAASMFGDLWIYDWNTYTWPQRNDVPGATMLMNLDFDTNGWLYVAHTDSPLYTTDDLGLTYSRFGRGLPTGGITHEVRCDPQIPGRAHVVSQSELYVTNDGPDGAGGGTWNVTGYGLPGTDIMSLIHHPAHPEIMFAGTLDHGVFISTNRGFTWSSLGLKGMPHASVIDLAISEDEPDYLYAASHSGSAFSGGLFRLRISR